MVGIIKTDFAKSASVLDDARLNKQIVRMILLKKNGTQLRKESVVMSVDLDHIIEKEIARHEAMNKNLPTYMKGRNISQSNEKYSLYTFEIKRTKSVVDEPIRFTTAARDSVEALDHIVQFFKRELLEFFYIIPQKVEPLLRPIKKEE